VLCQLKGMDGYGKYAVLLLNHHVKKGELCLHDNSDNGPGPGTYFSGQQALILHSDNIMPWSTMLVLWLSGEEGVGH